MPITHLSPNITTFNVPFERNGLIRFGGRATSIRLRHGGLAVISPVALTDEIRTALCKQSAGPSAGPGAAAAAASPNVAYLVAPDIEHHMHLTQWKREFPHAKIIAPAGLREKRARQRPRDDVPFDNVVSAENPRGETLPRDFRDEFSVQYFPTHANREIALLYKPERTLVAADLIFNLPAYEQYRDSGRSPTAGIATKIFTRLVGGLEGEAKGQQRFNWYLAGGSDRRAFAEAAKRVDEWDFTRIIPCHGEVIEKDGKAVWRKVFGWFLEIK